jgi:hypothetical protein
MFELLLEKMVIPSNAKLLSESLNEQGAYVEIEDALGHKWSIQQKTDFEEEMEDSNTIVNVFFFVIGREQNLTFEFHYTEDGISYCLEYSPEPDELNYHLSYYCWQSDEEQWQLIDVVAELQKQIQRAVEKRITLEHEWDPKKRLKALFEEITFR